jgi:hypothetical protein
MNAAQLKVLHKAQNTAYLEHTHSLLRAHVRSERPYMKCLVRITKNYLKATH